MRWFWMVFALVLVGCSGASSEISDGLPCDVGQVLESNCRRCHASPPVGGAPMPLLTWEDLHAPAKSDASQQVWQRMKARIHDAKSPMPPDVPLSPSDLATLDQWLDTGAPRAAMSCAKPDSGGTTPIGPSALPCPPSEQKTFVAHGDNGKFHVPADAGNLYECFTWHTPFGAGTQATAFAPIIDDARVVHHWILYQTNTVQPDGAFGPCNMPLDARFIAGWAPGGTNSVLPDDIGQSLPSTGSFILQLHYWNVNNLTDSNDASGVAMCTTTTPRPHAAAVVALGTVNISIPPHATDVVATGTCTDKSTQTIHVISTAPHMHRHGTAFRTTVFRGGDTSRADVLVDVPHWDFNNQPGHAIDMTIAPGDVLRTDCHYANDGDSAITFGEKTENEMCFNFLLVWPVEAISTIFGPVTYCND